MQRPRKQLWLPPEAREAAGEAVAPAPAYEENHSSHSSAVKGASNAADTDLDALTRQYEAEAAAARTKALGAAKSVAAQNKGMVERRNDALATPLSSDTRGFQMLAAMGYQPGQGIGKSVVGRATPLNVNLKAGRTGLGVDEAKRRREEAAQQEQGEREAKRLRGQDDMKHSFLHGRAASFAQRRAAEHLGKARVVCETLDRRAGSAESHMWPLPPPPEGEAEAEADADDSGGSWEDLPVEGRLSEVLEHLRQRHAYCFFCGCQYRDEEDLKLSCPGKWEDDH